MLFPLLHSPTDDSFLTSWAIAPQIVIGLLLAGILYALGIWRIRVRGRRAPSRWRTALFYIGLYVVALSLVGPLDTFNDDLFASHMLQHLLLMMVAAPCLLLGRPIQVALQALPPKTSGRVLGSVLRPRWVRVTLTVITYPVFVFLLYNANLVIWHIPEIYDAALRNDLIHEIEHLSFFGAALLFWWIIIDPVPRHHRISPHWLFGLVFATCMVGNTLAAGLTLSTRVLYPYYLERSNPWGISALADQHIGGGIMWISGLMYFGMLFGLLYRVANPSEQHEASRAHHLVG